MNRRKKLRNFKRIRWGLLYWASWHRFISKINELKYILEYEECDEEFIVSEIEKYEKMSDDYYKKLESMVNNRILTIKLDRMSKPYILYDESVATDVVMDKYYSIYHKGELVKVDYDEVVRGVTITKINNGEVSYKLRADLVVF